MSAVREGKHLANEAQHLTEKMRDGIVTGKADTSTQAQGGAVAMQLPRKMTAYDKMDDEMNMKMQLMDDEGMTPFGQVYYDDKVGRWLERKANVVEAANMDAWFNKNFNKNNLADRQFAQQINPDFYAAREKELLERANEVVKLKMMELRGPQSKEDVYKQFLINTGRVVLPEDWDRIGADPSKGAGPDKQQQEHFMQGLIRLPKFQVQSQRKVRALQNQVNGLWGDPKAAVNTFPWGTQGITGRENRPLSQAPNTFGMRVVDRLREQ